nr:hypothetical protein [Tanacetum cinerariifolium]
MQVVEAGYEGRGTGGSCRSLFVHTHGYKMKQIKDDKIQQSMYIMNYMLDPKNAARAATNSQNMDQNMIFCRQGSCSLAAIRDQQSSNGDVIVVEDDHDVIHDNNSSDLALSGSLNDLDFATFYIDGQSMKVEAPPCIITVGDNGDSIDDEDDVPRDLADSDNEIVDNADDDEAATMSAAVARGHDGDVGDDDLCCPPIREAGEATWMDEVRGCVKPPETSGSSKPELVREFPMHYPSWYAIEDAKKVQIRGRLMMGKNYQVKGSGSQYAHRGALHRGADIFHGDKGKIAGSHSRERRLLQQELEELRSVVKSDPRMAKLLSQLDSQSEVGLGNGVGVGVEVKGDPQSDSTNRKNYQVVGSLRNKKTNERDLLDDDKLRPFEENVMGSIFGKVKRLYSEDESSEFDDESRKSDKEDSELDEDVKTTPVENKNCKKDKFWNMPPLLKTPVLDINSKKGPEVAVVMNLSSFSSSSILANLGRLVQSGVAHLLTYFEHVYLQNTPKRPSTNLYHSRL